MDPYPIGTRVFFLSGGQTQIGVVEETERLEGIRMVTIKLDDVTKERPVKLPVEAVTKV
ncbi:hypothetical protein FKP32DRAFT_1676819 [Trametes sanguinea]|nr:hypothetical protein FKP32DRAFT_1676819 [Trametes sanguinea]